jgi:hypothetical protein
MKKIKIAYWIVNILFGGFMLFSAIPDILSSPDAVTFMTQLGYPLYFIPFIGVAKVLGVAAMFIPGFPRVTEWAYAGLMFDLVGAGYSVYCIGGAAGAAPMLIFIALGAAAYVLYHKKLKLQGTVI